MSNQSSYTVADALGSFFSGSRALSQFPALKPEIRKCYAINFVVLAVLFGLAIWGADLAIATFLEDYTFDDSGWTGTLTSILLWTVEAFLGVASFFLAMILSLFLMSFWYEDLAETTILESRGIKQSKTSAKAILLATIYGLKHSLNSLLLALLIVIAGFIPVVGWVIAFLGGAYLIGKDLAGVYISTLKSNDFDVHTSAFGAKSKAIWIGLPLMALTLIPVIGWLLVPWFTVRTVLGVTYRCETLRGQVSK